MLDLLVLHRRRLRRWAPDTPQTRLIQNLVEERRKLVNEKTAIINNLTNRLKLYFPQMLEWFNPIDTSLEQLQKLSSATLRRFFHRHHRPPGGLDRKPDQRDWPGAAGAERPCHPRCAGSGGSRCWCSYWPSCAKASQNWISKWHKLQPSILTFTCSKACRELGRVMAPRLLAAMGTQRDRYRNANELQTFSGIAPVMERSGQKKWVHSRWRCPKFLRQSFHEWAGHTIRFFNLGSRLLSTTTNSRKGPPCCNPQPGFQMDPHPVPLLARSRGLRREPVYDEAGPARLTLSASSQRCRSCEFKVINLPRSC